MAAGPSVFSELFQKHKQQIDDNVDTLTLFTHWYLIFQGYALIKNNQIIDISNQID